MCVIIDRQPGIEIPFEKLVLACDINKHGYGFAIPDRGRLEIFKSTKQPNDPDEVAKLLDKYKKQRVYLHLRHATVGSVNPDNQHPFVALEQKRKPVMAFMHNGTLYGPYSPPYQDQTTSDTKLFCEKLVRPLAYKTFKACGPKNVLQDQFFQWLICKETGANSVLLFFDAFGNTLRINESKGHKFDGWWASNSYSFDTEHIRSSQRKMPGGTIWHAGQVNNNNTSGPVRYGQNATNPQSYDWQRGDNLPWQEDTDVGNLMANWEDELISTTGGESSKSGGCTSLVPVVPSPSVVKDDKRQAWEIQKMAKQLEAATKVNGDSAIMNADGPIIRSQKVERIPFVKRAQLNSLDQVGAFSENDLIELAANWPQATAALVIDLLFDRHRLKIERESLKKANDSIAEQVGQMEIRLHNQASLIKSLRGEDATS